MATTLGGSIWNSQMVLSNGNLTATANFGDSVAGIATNPITSKAYFEVSSDVVASAGQCGFGVGNDSIDPRNYSGANNNSYAYWPGDGHTWTNGAQAVALATTTSPAVIRIAVDPVAKLIWFAIGAGQWNNSGTADPATGTGGLSFSNVSGTVYPAMSLTANTEQATARFLAGSWSFSAPSGFSAITDPSTGSTATITGLGTATFLGRAEARGVLSTSGAGTPSFISRATASVAALISGSGIFNAIAAPPPATRTVVYLTTTGAGTWTVPSDWNRNANDIECIGGGSSATQVGSSSLSSKGGAGGAYSKISNINLTPGAVINFSVGAGGASTTTNTSNPGADTWFGATTFAASLVGAKGGSAGVVSNAPAAGPLGGRASAGIGTVKYSGGDGGAGTTTVNPGATGGGAAGPNGAGTAGKASGGAGTGSAGGPSGGGAGGAGGGGVAAGAGGNGTEWDATHGSGGGGGGGAYSGGSTFTGGAGGLYGGGGGASLLGAATGAGGQGIIRISYAPGSPTVASIVGTSIASFVGAATAPMVAAIAGTSVGAFLGRSLASAAATIAGTSVGQFVSNAIKSAVATFTGVSNADFQARAEGPASVAINGTSVAQFSSAADKYTNTTIAGNSTAAFLGIGTRTWALDQGTYTVVPFDPVMGTGITLYPDVGIYGVAFFEPWMYFTSYEGPHYKTIYVPSNNPPILVRGERQIIMVPFEPRDTDATR